MYQPETVSQCEDGKMLLGHYEILETLGQGASGTVFRARHTLIGRIVAIKLLQTGLGSDEWRERILREASIVGELSHPSIVTLYDVGIDPSSGAPYLILEYVPGRTLEKLLATGRVPLQNALAWGKDLARALSYLHRHGVIHGDVKPANILVDERGRVKLTDFGVARLMSHTPEDNHISGTPAYLAPEQIQGVARDFRSDLFSFGVVLYELVTGRNPFRAPSVPEVCENILRHSPVAPSSLNPSLSRVFDPILLRCLCKDPEDRYPDGELIASDLDRAMHPLPVRPRRRASDRRKAMLLRALAWASPVIFLALSGTFAQGFVRRRFREPEPPPAVFQAPPPPQSFLPLPGPCSASHPVPALAPSARHEPLPAAQDPAAR